MSPAQRLVGSNLVKTPDNLHFIKDQFIERSPDVESSLLDLAPQVAQPNQPPPTGQPTSRRPPNNHDSAVATLPTVSKI